MKTKTWSIPATLEKAASPYEVGGVASSFYRDLDGEAITPDAVREAIPGFMANRGADGIQGGPIRLHHDFWQRFLRQAIDSLLLDKDTQMDLVAAIALPLGRVTKIWVDDQGTTHWRGNLSQANPVARIIWQLLKEGLIHLGVSLGGKIFETATGGRDKLGRPCTLITRIRIDELSITDNPALRLVENEDTGAYIMALAKSVQSALSPAPALVPRKKAVNVEAFLQKAIASTFDTNDMMQQGNRAMRAVDGSGTKTGMGDRSLGEPKTVSPRGTSTVKMDSAQPTTGMGGKAKSQPHPAATSKEPKTDVWGMSVGQLARELGKCCGMSKAQWADKDMVKMLTDASWGLTTITPEPTPDLINMVRFLQKLVQAAQELPHMSDYQADGTVEAMNRDFGKALESFVEKMPKDLMSQTFRPPGSPGIAGLDIVFPQQYVTY